MKSSVMHPLGWSGEGPDTKTVGAKTKADRWWFGEVGQWAALLGCLFLILFPKGGFKIGPIPITWGYILIGIFAVTALPKALLDPNLLRPRRAVVVFFICMAPYQILTLLEFLAGVDDVGFAISVVTGLIVFPVIFLILWRQWYTEHTLTALLRISRVCIIAAALYGIFLFFYKVATGHLIEVPYLTVNIAEVGLLESTKSIDRGGLFKLISTYNNGNVYGVATLILLPLYDRLETSKIFKLALRVALLLTFSRTVWAGILCERLLTMGALLLKSWQQFPTIEKRVFRRSVGNVILLTALVGAVLLVTAYGSFTAANFSKNFLTDTELGGRASDQIPTLSQITLFKLGTFTGIREMVFFSAMISMGVVGFVSLLTFFLAPVIIAWQDRSVLKNPIRRAALKGMFIYFIVAWVDGALEFIPVMAFYWIAAAVLIYWPTKQMTIATNSPSQSAF